MADRLRYCRRCNRIFLPDHAAAPKYRCPAGCPCWTVEVALTDEVVQAIRAPVFEAIDSYLDDVVEGTGGLDFAVSALEDRASKGWARLQELRGGGDD